MFDNNFHYISIIVIRGEPVVSFTKLDLPKLFRNMITFNDCRMAVSLYVLINDQNIAILRRKSLTTDIIDRLYTPEPSLNSIFARVTLHHYTGPQSGIVLRGSLNYHEYT